MVKLSIFIADYMPEGESNDSQIHFHSCVGELLDIVDANGVPSSSYFIGDLTTQIPRDLTILFCIVSLVFSSSASRHRCSERHM